MSGGRGDTVLVTGGTGLIGSHVVRALLENGYQPRVFSRQPSLTLMADVEHVAGDVRDPQALARAMCGCRAAIHTAAVYSYARADIPAMTSTNVQGTSNVLAAAAQAGVDRVVVTSSSATCGPVAGRPAHEHDRSPQWELTVPYKSSKLAAERIALARAAEGQDIVIVNPTTTMGAEDHRPTPSGCIIRDVMTRRIRGYIASGGLNVVSADDVARGHILALERGRAGERYLLGGENLPMRELFALIAKLAGVPAPWVRIPYSAALAAATLLDAAARTITGREPSLLVLDEVRLARLPLYFAIDKAQGELGYTHQPAAQALAAAVAWFAERQAATPAPGRYGARRARFTGRKTPKTVREAASGSAPLRALILSADVGESHLAMAQSLADDLRRRDPTASVVVRNDFGVLGPTLGRLLGRGYQYHLGTVTWSYNITYGLFTRVRLAQRLGELALYTLGGSALAATVAGHDPDVVVATHPVITTVLGRLRAAGRLRCPVAAVVGPLGGLDFWVHPGIDLHLLTYEQSLPEVQRDAGGAEGVVAVQPLVREEFFSAPTQADARAQLGVAAQERLLLISGGGWGAGDLDEAVQACLAVLGTRVIVVAGRNEQLRQRMEQCHGSDPRVTVLGFTERMSQLLSAADVFVTTTAGLSCLEAQLCGCPTVCSGSAIGHVRDNTAALARQGLARNATTPALLVTELTAALTAGRAAVSKPRADLPRAAEITARLVDADRGRRTG